MWENLDKYLNELYGVYDKVHEINWQILPNKFAIESQWKSY